MSLSSGNMYSIPEHPTEDDFIEEGYCEVSLSEEGTDTSDATEKVSSASLPEKTRELPEADPRHESNASATHAATSETTVVVTGSETLQVDMKKLSVSLFDLPSFDLSADSGTFKADNGSTFANTSSSRMISANNSESYLDVRDCISHSNHGREGQTLLSATASHDDNNKANNDSNSARDSHGCRSDGRKNSDNIVFVDLDEGAGRWLSPEDIGGPSVLRQRSRSLQWIQSTFQNVSNKYRWLLEIRRPSDIVEERMRKSREEMEMEEPEYEILAEKQAAGPRRFSENIIGKQKRFFPFTSRFGHLKDLWKDKNPASRRQEEKDIDQTRPDVCPLFTFPRKGDEDEQILDALRQAMRKCTAVDPTTRPTSSTVLDQLSKLLD